METSVPRGEAVRRLKVLSVEDDVLVAMGTTGTLEDLGHEVVEAASGEEALAMLDRHPDIDLVITDHGMVRMTGVELAAAVRILRPSLPVILVTGYLERPDDGLLRLIVLQKPFRAAELAEAIRLALSDGLRAAG